MTIFVTLKGQSKKNYQLYLCFASRWGLYDSIFVSSCHDRFKDQWASFVFICYQLPGHSANQGNAAEKQDLKKYKALTALQREGGDGEDTGGEGERYPYGAAVQDLGV